jgi:protein ImuA
MTEYHPHLFEEASRFPETGPCPATLSPDRAARLDRARRVVERLERAERAARTRHGVLATGFAAVDAALPDGGLALGGIHEILGLGSRRFALALLRQRLRRTAAPAAWIVPRHAADALYGPGLACRGVDPDRVIIIRYGAAAEGLWCLEEALKSRAFAMVLGQPEGVLGTVAARRLQLAAEAGGALGLLLSDGQRALSAPGSATSRWRVDPAPADPGPGVTRRAALTLERHRGAAGVEAGAEGGARWLVDLA